MSIEQHKYPKSLLGKLRNTTNRNILPVVGGDNDCKVPKFDDFAPFLPPYPLDPQSIEAERLNTGMPQILDALLFSGSRGLKDRSYIEAIGGQDFGNILQIAMRTALLGKKDPETVIRVVYGGTNEMSLRALSGLLPPLVYLEHLQEQRVSIPQLQTIFADHISSSANGHVDFKEAKRQSDRFSGLARRYIAEFFPSLRDFVVFLRDTPVSPGAILGQELAAVSQVAGQIISARVRQALVSKGQNSDEQSSITYGAAHVIPHDIALPGVFVPVITDQPVAIEAPTAIISMGGRQERFFYGLRHEIKPHLPEKYHQAITFQFFTRHQAPPYYMAQDGDVALDRSDQLNEFMKTADGIGKTAAQYDLQYLMEQSADRNDFFDFLTKNERVMV